MFVDIIHDPLFIPTAVTPTLYSGLDTLPAELGLQPMFSVRS